MKYADFYRAVAERYREIADEAEAHAEKLSAKDEPDMPPHLLAFVDQAMAQMKLNLKIFKRVIEREAR